MDFKKLLSSFDAVENGTSENAINMKKETGSMLAILESFDNATDADVGPAVEAVGEPASPIYDLINEIGSHQIVLDELIRYLDVDQIEDFVSDFRRHHDMDMNEGKMSDKMIDDAETMSKEEFAKKHGKEKADEYFESVNEAKPDFLDIDKDGDKKESMKKAAKDAKKKKVDESEERPYVCVHAKKGKHECKAKSSYEAAKKAASHWKMKSTAGIDAHLADKEKVAEEIEEAIMVSAEGSEAAELLSILKLSGMSAEEPAPAPALPAPMEPEMEMQDEYSNSPDEMEQDVDAVIASGDDLNREKDQYAASADGDNPMAAFEGKFEAMLNELLAEDEK